LSSQFWRRLCTWWLLQLHSSQRPITRTGPRDRAGHKEVVETERKRCEECHQIPHTRTQQEALLEDVTYNRTQQEQSSGNIIDTLHMETKGIEKALMASFWGLRGTNTLVFWFCNFWQIEKRSHDYAAPCYAIYASKPLRKQKTIISSLSSCLF
jgi:hypothetical protein